MTLANLDDIFSGKVSSPAVGSGSGGGGELSPNIAQWEEIIEEAAQQYPTVPREIIRGVIHQESRGQQNAESPENGLWKNGRLKGLPKGTAKGLMQMLDATAEENGVSNSWDPRENILGGTKYLSRLLERNGGDYGKALFQYHGGGTDVTGQDSNNYADTVLGLAKMSKRGGKLSTLDKIFGTPGDDEFDPQNRPESAGQTPPRQDSQSLNAFATEQGGQGDTSGIEFETADPASTAADTQLTEDPRMRVGPADQTLAEDIFEGGDDPKADPMEAIKKELREDIAQSVISGIQETFLGRTAIKGLAAHRGFRKSFPGVSALGGDEMDQSAIGTAAEKEHPNYVVGGQIGGTVLQQLTGMGLLNEAGAPQKLNALLGAVKNNRLRATLGNGIIRASIGTAQSGGLNAEQVAMGKKSVAEALIHTAETTAAHLVSPFPEMWLPRNAIQLVAQPIAGALVNVGSDLIQGKNSWTDEAERKQIIIEMAMDAAFSLFDLDGKRLSFPDAIKPGQDVQLRHPAEIFAKQSDEALDDFIRESTPEELNAITDKALDLVERSELREKIGEDEADARIENRRKGLRKEADVSGSGEGTVSTNRLDVPKEAEEQAVQSAKDILAKLNTNNRELLETRTKLRGIGDTDLDRLLPSPETRSKTRQEAGQQKLDDAQNQPAGGKINMRGPRQVGDIIDDWRPRDPKWSNKFNEMGPVEQRAALSNARKEVADRIGGDITDRQKFQYEELDTDLRRKIVSIGKTTEAKAIKGEKAASAEAKQKGKYVETGEATRQDWDAFKDDVEDVLKHPDFEMEDIQFDMSSKYGKFFEDAEMREAIDAISKGQKDGEAAKRIRQYFAEEVPEVGFRPAQEIVARFKGEDIDILKEDLGFLEEGDADLPATKIEPEADAEPVAKTEAPEPEAAPAKAEPTPPAVPKADDVGFTYIKKTGEHVGRVAGKEVAITKDADGTWHVSKRTTVDLGIKEPADGIGSTKRRAEEWMKTRVEGGKEAKAPEVPVKKVTASPEIIVVKKTLKSGTLEGFEDARSEVQQKIDQEKAKKAKEVAQKEVTELPIFDTETQKVEQQTLLKRSKGLGQTGHIALNGVKQVGVESSSRVEAPFQKMDDEIRRKNKLTLNKLATEFDAKILDQSGPATNLLRKNSVGAEAAMHHDLSRGSGAEAKRQLELAKKRIYQHVPHNHQQLFNRFLAAKRIIEVHKLKGPDFKSPITPKQAQDLLDDLKKDKVVWDSFNKAGQRYWDTMLNQLAQLRKHGLISDALFKDLKKNHKNYMPRQFIEFMDPGSGNSLSVGGKKINVTDSGIKALDEGSESALFTNSEMLLAQTIARTQGRIFKNTANQKLADYARGVDNNDMGVKIEEPIGKHKNGSDKYGEVPRGMTRITAMENGKATNMLMPDEMAKYWIHADPVQDRAWADFLGHALGTKMVKFLATGINPEFAIMNLPRDIMLAWASTKEFSAHLPIGLGQFAVDFFQTASDAIHQKGAYKDFIKQGGGLDSMTQQAFGGKKPWELRSKNDETLEKLSETLGWLGNFTERWTRLALRNRALKNGKSATEATAIARGYLDFAKGGSYVKAADSFIPYFNAAVQGSRSLARAFKEDPKIASYKAAQVMAVGFGMAMANKLVNGDAYDEIGDKEKETKFIITTPLTYEDDNGNTRHHYFAISKDQGQRFFAMVGQVMAEAVTGGDTKASMESLAATALDFFSLDLGTKVPPLAAAALAYAFNIDTWTRRNIWNGRKGVKPKLEQYGDTPAFWKAVGEIAGGGEEGKGAGISPSRADVALGKMIPNTIYSEAVGAGWEAMLEGVPDKDKSKLNKTIVQRMSEFPMTRKFTRTTWPVRVGKKEVREKAKKYKIDLYGDDDTQKSTRQLDKEIKEYEAGINNKKQINDNAIKRLFARELAGFSEAPEERRKFILKLRTKDNAEWKRIRRLDDEFKRKNNKR